MTGSHWQRLVFAGILLVTVGLGARGITDEASVMLSGDMARYVMNGVFLHDLIASGGVWSLDDLTSYAERYFARYPALSIGHHPPLLYVALVPFYAVFGISLFSARLAALTFFVLGTWGFYSLARRLYGWHAASWATLLFITNVMVLRAGQYALSEMPMIALVLASLNALLLYCDTGRKKHFTWFVVAAAASLYAKQLAVFMFPVYGLILVTRLGWRRLFDRHVIVLTVIGGLLVAPLGVMTLALSPANVRLATNAANLLVSGTRHVSVPEIITIIVGSHLSLPVLAVAMAGTAVLVARRDRHVVIGLAWILAVVGGTVVFAAGIEPARYAFAALPAYFLLAAGLAANPRSRAARWVAVLVLSCATLWQVWLIRHVFPSRAGGYEAAARYVVDHGAGPAVLFDGYVDTGYFVFFVRKHDPDGRRLVLRAEKLLLGENAGAAGGRIERSDQIHSILQRFGIQFVVVEERDRGPRQLMLLHEELATDRFIERQRIPIETTESRARGRSLVVYEYREAQPPDPDAEVSIGIRLARRQIKLKLGDLVGPTAR